VSKYTDWIQVRIRRHVHAKLVAATLETETLAAERPQRYPPFVCVEQVSLSAMIELLLLRRDQHLARSRRVKEPSDLRIADGT